MFLNETHNAFGLLTPLRSFSYKKTLFIELSQSQTTVDAASCKNLFTVDYTFRTSIYKDLSKILKDLIDLDTVFVGTISNFSTTYSNNVSYAFRYFPLSRLSLLIYPYTHRQVSTKHFSVDANRENFQLKFCAGQAC